MVDVGGRIVFALWVLFALWIIFTKTKEKIGRERKKPAEPTAIGVRCARARGGMLSNAVRAHHCSAS